MNVLDGMFQRQITQAYTPILSSLSFPPSYNDILNAPEFTAARRNTLASEGTKSGQEASRMEDGGASASGEEQGRRHTWSLETGALLKTPVATDAHPRNCTDTAATGSEKKEGTHSVSGEALDTDAAKKSDDVEAPGDTATQETSGPDSSRMPDGEGSGKDEDWSDVENSDHEGKADTRPLMLGNYKVTRAPLPPPQSQPLP